MFHLLLLTLCALETTWCTMGCASYRSLNSQRSGHRSYKLTRFPRGLRSCSIAARQGRIRGSLQAAALGDARHRSTAQQMWGVKAWVEAGAAKDAAGKKCGVKPQLSQRLPPALSTSWWSLWPRHSPQETRHCRHSSNATEHRPWITCSWLPAATGISSHLSGGHKAQQDIRGTRQCSKMAQVSPVHGSQLP